MNIRKCKILFVTTLLLSIFAAKSALAADIYCGNQWVSADNNLTIYTEQSVKKLCGTPTKIKNRTNVKFIKTAYGYNKVATHYSQWTYNRGSNTFIEYLLFQNGTLISIRDGGYGSP